MVLVTPAVVPEVPGGRGTLPVRTERGPPHQQELANRLVKKTSANSGRRPGEVWFVAGAPQLDWCDICPFCHEKRGRPVWWAGDGPCPGCRATLDRLDRLDRADKRPHR